MRLSSVLILMLTITSLHAQTKEADEKWIGINNLFFKNKDTNTSSPLPAGTLLEELLDKQLSFGLYYRKINKKKVYKQFDLLAISWKESKEKTVQLSSWYPEITSGKEVKEFNVLVGYQQGKLFQIKPKLYGDVGIRTYAWYKTIDNKPLNSAGYPISVKSTGIGLNLEVGLNYQVFKRINIGYNIVPVAFKMFWNEDYTHNPILPETQKRERSLKFNNDFFDSVINLRNFHISYVF